MPMNIRPIDWRDLPVLHRYRDRCLVLDSTMALTQGTSLGSAKTLLSSLSPAAGIFTYAGVDDGHAEQLLLGQVVLPPGTSSARLTFLAPETILETPGIVSFLEQITIQMGERGAFHLLAEVDECDQACEVLHQAGFAIYARQRIWQLRGEPVSAGDPTPWRAIVDQDLIGIRSLYNNLTPGLVQQVESPIPNRTRGMIYEQSGDWLAYVELRYGPKGIWAQPFIHPDLEGVPGRLSHLLHNLPDRRSRPVYLCVRSYQSWLEAAMEELGAQSGPRQAVIVRRLSAARRAVVPHALPVLEGKQAEPTVPVVPISNSHGLQDG